MPGRPAVRRVRFDVLLISLSLLLLLPVQPARAGQEAPLVTVAAVVEEAASAQVTVSATVEPLLESRLASRVDGLVAAVHVTVGERVAQGGPLVTLDDSEARHALHIHIAEVAEARERLKQAETDLERDRRLRETDAVSRQRLDDRSAEVAIRRALLQKSLAQQALARERLSWFRVTAPFAGVVTDRPPRPGQWLGQGEPVLGLIDPARLEIKAMLPGDLAAQLPPETHARASWQHDGQEVTAPVALRTLIPRGDPVSRNHPAYWRVDTTDRLLPGQEVILRIPTAPASRMLLAPKDAVIREGDNTLVYVVEEEKIRAAAVRLGAEVGDRVRVLEGVQAGEMLVIRGNERVRPGQTVRSGLLPETATPGGGQP